jgi:hypothetical protein
MRTGAHHDMPCAPVRIIICHACFFWHKVHINTDIYLFICLGKPPPHTIKAAASSATPATPINQKQLHPIQTPYTNNAVPKIRKRKHPNEAAPTGIAFEEEDDDARFPFPPPAGQTSMDDFLQNSSYTQPHASKQLPSTQYTTQGFATTLQPQGTTTKLQQHGFSTTPQPQGTTTTPQPQNTGRPLVNTNSSDNNKLNTTSGVDTKASSVTPRQATIDLNIEVALIAADMQMLRLQKLHFLELQEHENKNAALSKEIVSLQSELSNLRSSSSTKVEKLQNDRRMLQQNVKHLETQLVDKEQLILQYQHLLETSRAFGTQNPVHSPSGVYAAYTTAYSPPVPSQYEEDERMLENAEDNVNDNTEFENKGFSSNLNYSGTTQRADNVPPFSNTTQHYHSHTPPFSQENQQHHMQAPPFIQPNQQNYNQASLDHSQVPQSQVPQSQVPQSQVPQSQVPQSQAQQHKPNQVYPSHSLGGEEPTLGKMDNSTYQPKIPSGAPQQVGGNTTPKHSQSPKINNYAQSAVSGAVIQQPTATGSNNDQGEQG